MNMTGITHLLAKEDLTSGIFDGISFDTDTALLIFRIILAIACGIVIASLVSLYDKRYLGSLVRGLIDAGAHSPDTATTLYELGLDDKLGIRLALRRGYTFSRFVVCVEEEEHKISQARAKEEFYAAHKDDKKPPKYKETSFCADMDTARYYIPEEMVTDAGTKFSQKGANWLGVLIVLSILAVILGLCIIFLPKIVELAGLILTN